MSDIEKQFRIKCNEVIARNSITRNLSEEEKSSLRIFVKDKYFSDYNFNPHAICLLNADKIAHYAEQIIAQPYSVDSPEVQTIISHHTLSGLPSDVLRQNVWFFQIQTALHIDGYSLHNVDRDTIRQIIQDEFQSN